ncbi:thioredoxin family protein [Salibacteraceae bacterium]|jgi:peroxiredoxin|nr:thioredoxin family protein [Salibacteraceae bacterium]
MKKILFTSSIFSLSLLLFFAFRPAENTSLSIGEKAPMADVKMADIDGSSKSLQDLNSKNGLLVVFSCNTCPFVIAWEDRYNELDALCKKNGIGMVLVNSNEARRAGDDSMDKMKKHAKELGYTMPYVVDSKSALANAFGARTTPHIYLFDKEMKLAYTGLIDDNHRSKDEVSKSFLKDAIQNLASGKNIDPAETKSMGCSIKRV